MSGNKLIGPKPVYDPELAPEQVSCVVCYHGDVTQ